MEIGEAYSAFNWTAIGNKDIRFSGTIKNVSVTDSYISGDTYVGGVVGYNMGTISHCYNNGKVSTTVPAEAKVNCNGEWSGNNSDYANNNAFAYTYSYAGGIAGYGDKFSKVEVPTILKQGRGQSKSNFYRLFLHLRKKNLFYTYSRKVA